MNFSKLTEYLDSLENVYGVPAFDCRITKKHQEVYRHMAGYSDYEHKLPVAKESLYRMFSLTKVITATAVMQMAERGKLNLYDELYKFLPEFEFMQVADDFPVGQKAGPRRWPTRETRCHLAHNSIRLIDLLTMTAGMSYDMQSEALMQMRYESNYHASTREVASAIAKMPLLYEPGTRWDYSLSHDVLGAVVEVVSGMSYGEYLRKYIFAPLGIEDFYFCLNQKSEERVCALYESDEENGIISPADMGRYTATFKITENCESGGGGLIGTTEAYSTVMDALCCGGIGANGERILSEKTVRLMSTNYITGQMKTDFDTFQKKGYGYGLGVRVLTDPETSLSPLGEFGWDGAGGGYTLVDPYHQISITYMQHVIGLTEVYEVVHPTIRDLVYEAMEI